MAALPLLALLLAAPSGQQLQAGLSVGAVMTAVPLASLSMRDHWLREDGWSWGWSRWDWALEGEGDLLMAADMLTTLNIGRRPGLDESNRWLGHRPPRAAVVGYFAALGAGRLLVSAALPGRLRPAWQALSITLSAGMVGGNLTNGLSLGIRMRWG